MSSLSYSAIAPTPFIGWSGYPKVKLGFLAHKEVDVDLPYDDPIAWAQSNLPISKLMAYRRVLAHHHQLLSIKDHEKLHQVSQEIAMGIKPAQVEVALKDNPVFKFHVNPYTAPFGPLASIQNVKITNNIAVENKIEQAVNDTDVSASQIINELYNKGVDETQLSRLLSTGSLGFKRKFVPTRWSITGVDDTVGKELITKIQDFSTQSLCVYQGSYLGNYYFILLLPQVWGYELFETSLKEFNRDQPCEQSYGHDYEEQWGRKEYARETAGGYYAARIAILEKLIQLKRQARVIAFRFVSREYTAPMGVWVVRQAVRKSMGAQPVFFDTIELALQFCQVMIKRRLSYNFDWVKTKSIFLNQKQKTLADF